MRDRALYCKRGLGCISVHGTEIAVMYRIMHVVIEREGGEMQEVVSHHR